MTAAIPVADAALAVLRETFGYDAFRGAQGDIVSHVASGGDALVLMPTGGGKSLCYQIPALLRAGTGIVVSPLIALMQDQVAALTQAGVRAAFLNSSQDAAQSRNVERALLVGDLAQSIARFDSTNAATGQFRFEPVEDSGGAAVLARSTSPPKTV